jgi:hypothetical protein
MKHLNKVEKNNAQLLCASCRDLSEAANFSFIFDAHLNNHPPQKQKSIHLHFVLNLNVLSCVVLITDLLRESPAKRGITYQHKLKFKDLRQISVSLSLHLSANIDRTSK